MNKSKEYENCVLCGGNTKVLKSTHIDYRDYYIEGAGQLCRKCAHQVQGR